MSEIERYAAAFAIAGLSTRLSELFELDRAEESATP
jgi:hypothetical protein